MQHDADAPIRVTGFDVAAADIAAQWTDVIFDTVRATEGRLSEPMRPAIKLAARHTVKGYLEFVHQAAWTQALDTEPGPVKPARSTAALIAQIADLAARITKRSSHNCDVESLRLMEDAVGSLSDWTDEVADWKDEHA